MEQRVLAWREGCVTGDRAQASGSQGSIDALEELQEDQADGISLGQQLVAARAGQLFDKAFHAELGEVVSKRGQAVLLGGGAQGGNGMRIDLGGAEGPCPWGLCEAGQNRPPGEVSRVVER